MIKFQKIAGTTLNLNSLKAPRSANKTEFHLYLDLSSILDDFDTESKQDLEKTQVCYNSFDLFSKRLFKLTLANYRKYRHTKSSYVIWTFLKKSTDFTVNSVLTLARTTRTFSIACSSGVFCSTVEFISTKTI